jgi:hypothetical protein
VSELQIAADYLEAGGFPEQAAWLRETKCFIVTAGSYSDYSIYGVFSSRENAQVYIDARIENGLGFGDTPDIEEWEIDAGLRERSHTRWFVGMFLDDGAICEAVKSSEQFCDPVNAIDGIARVPCYNNRPIVRVQSVDSAEHAMKLAVEARQKWLRGDLICR